MPWETKKLIWKLWESGATISNTLTHFEENPQEHPVYSRQTIAKVRDELTKLPVNKLDQLLSELPEIKDFIKELRPDYAKAKAEGSEQQSQRSRELSTTALILASNLEKIRNEPAAFLGTEMDRVEEGVYGGRWIGEDRAKLGDVNRNAAAELLKRLKEEEEFPELADLDDWKDLNDTKVTENFIQRLIIRAHKGNL